MTSCEIRPASAQDILSFYGHAPSCRTKAIIVLIDNKPMGIAGLQYRNIGIVAFSDMKDEMRPYKKAILKTARALAELVSRQRRRVFAIAELPTSPAILERIGFERVTDEVYQWVS